MSKKRTVATRLRVSERSWDPDILIALACHNKDHISKSARTVKPIYYFTVFLVKKSTEENFEDGSRSTRARGAPQCLHSNARDNE